MASNEYSALKWFHYVLCVVVMENLSLCNRAIFLHLLRPWGGWELNSSCYCCCCCLLPYGVCLLVLSSCWHDVSQKEYHRPYIEKISHPNAWVCLLPLPIDFGYGVLIVRNFRLVVGPRPQHSEQLFQDFVQRNRG